MPCTTILVGRKASYDGSTMIARTDDGDFDVKKLVVTVPGRQPRKYKSVGGHFTIELPDDPLPYTQSPNVDKKDGVWPTTGINAANVGMTATETITTNARVLGADPLVKYVKARKRGDRDVPGGIGEEDMLLLVLPYIKSAREGVRRLGELLEKYGTCESNGIAFNDAGEIWWLETIGGHHWIAKRVRDEEVVIMPNRFGMDSFDFDDAYGKQKEHMCSGDLKDFVVKNHLDLNRDGAFDPRWAFGSHDEADHIYSTPRAWYMGRFFCPDSRSWDGPDADYGPESDDIPWALVPDRKVTAEDIKTILGSHYQGTPYDPYSASAEKSGCYRSIGTPRTGVMGICQIRGYMPEAIRAVEWICFGSTTFDAIFPVYTNVKKLPRYLSDVKTDVSTENFYWASRLIGTLADSCYPRSIGIIEEYQETVAARGHQLIAEYDSRMVKEKSYGLMAEANEKLCEMAREETRACLNKVLHTAGLNMKNGYDRSKR